MTATAVARIESVLAKEKREYAHAKVPFSKPLVTHYMRNEIDKELEES